MANLALAKMLFPVATSSGTYSNLMTPDPKEIASGNSGLDMDLDFGVAVTADTFFAGFISPAAAPDFLQITPETGYATGIGAPIPLNLGSSTALRRHAYAKVGTPVTSRFWRLTFGGAAAWQVGICGIGLAVQPTWGHEWGSGRQPLDSGVVTPLRGGGFAVERGAVKGAWQFTTGDLTDADLKALWALTLDIGISSPVLAVEDPAAAEPDLNDGLHYGLLARPEAYERQLGGHRWSWRVEEWV